MRVAIWGPKDGVGKSLIATSLASILARSQDVLLVDADEHSTLTSILGEVEYGWEEAVGEIGDIKLPRHSDGFDVLLYRHQAHIPFDFQTVDSTISKLRKYNTIIFDCCGGLTSVLTRYALKNSFKIVLVTTCDNPTVTLTTHTLSRLMALKLYEANKFSIVLNRCTGNVKKKIQAIEEPWPNGWGLKVISSIQEDIKVQEVQERSRIFVNAYQKSPVTQGIEQIASSLKG